MRQELTVAGSKVSPDGGSKSTRGEALAGAGSIGGGFGEAGDRMTTNRSCHEVVLLIEL
jgi:hypothetical protein